MRRPGGAPPSAYPQPRTGGVVLMGTRGVCNAELGVRFPPPPLAWLLAWRFRSDRKAEGGNGFLFHTIPASLERTPDLGVLLLRLRGEQELAAVSAQKNLRILKLNRKVGALVTVTLKNTAGLTSSASKKIKLNSGPT